MIDIADLEKTYANDTIDYEVYEAKVAELETELAYAVEMVAYYKALLDAALAG